MRFFKELNPVENESQPPVNKPVPMRPKDKVSDNSNQLADLDTVARKLRMSKRHVQAPVRRRAIHTAGPSLHKVRPRQRDERGEEIRRPGCFSRYRFYLRSSAVLSPAL
jgi:hypothetical protein